MQTKPGLSAYAANPEEAVNSLKSLLNDAINAVPVEKRSATPVRLGVILFYDFLTILNSILSLLVCKI